MVILHSKSSGWLIDEYFIIILPILNNKRHIFCYCILDFDDSLIFDMFLYVIYNHVSKIFLTIDLLSFLSQRFEAVK